MKAVDFIEAALKNQQYTWLVTGVAGFIGSHLLDFLLHHQQKVIGLDNFSTGYKKNLDEVLAKHPPSTQVLFRFIEGDIQDLATCQMAVNNVDFVLHQAALGSVPRSIETPLVTHGSNVTGFLNMLLAAKDNRVKRFIYASSSAVYGDSPLLPKVETHQGNPLSPYAVSKMTNELYSATFSRCYPIETIGLRYFNVFGARQDPNGPYAAVIPLWVKSLLQNEPVYVNGDGETSRDFCFINNVVQANILAALTNDKAAVNTVYNVAVGERTTLNQLYEHLIKLLDKPGFKPHYRDFRAGDVQHSLADISRARGLLGYEPTHTVELGLREAVGWYTSSIS